MASELFAKPHNFLGLMVEQGWALAYRKYSEDYVRQEAAAKASKAGVWAGEFVEPGEWRRK